MATEISRIRKNSMGTISFDLKAKRMRKAQDFVTYPITKQTNEVWFQSDKKWIVLNLETKTARISTNGNTSWQFMMGNEELEITEAQIDELVEAIKGTSSKNAGSNGVVFCDNSGANLL